MAGADVGTCLVPWAWEGGWGSKLAPNFNPPSCFSAIPPACLQRYLALPILEPSKILQGIISASYWLPSCGHLAERRKLRSTAIVTCLSVLCLPIFLHWVGVSHLLVFPSLFTFFLFIALPFLHPTSGEFWGLSKDQHLHD